MGDYSTRLNNRLRKNKKLNGGGRLTTGANDAGGKILKGLYLDDRRYAGEVERESYPPNVRWKLVRDSIAFVEAIREEDFDIVSFDWDLGEGKFSGEYCLERFIENCKFRDKWPDKVIFHSGDYQKAAQMQRHYERQKMDYENGGL